MPNHKTTKQSKRIGLYLGPSLFVLCLIFFNPEGLSIEAKAILASTLWIATWWILEAIPIAVTALLPIILFPLSGGLSLNDTTISYGHKYIFLYIGGFILAIAIERWNLHKRIALIVINIMGTNIKMIILGFMVATAFLSMWISNTATSVMMLPIGLAIVAQLKDNPNTQTNEHMVFGKMLMLAIAYSASIGGICTLIGTPPNLVFAGIIEDSFGIEITFLQWLKFGLPISIILLFLCWKYITEWAFDIQRTSFPGGKNEINNQIKKLGKISKEEKIVLTVFVLTALAWITRSFVLTQFIPSIDDTIIAMISAVLLFLIPCPSNKSRSIVTWEEAVKMPWGILLLFGGGLAIAQGFKMTGLAAWVANQMNLLDGVAIILIVLALVALINFLTEITSNLAASAIILPILIPLAIAIDIHPFLLMGAATIAASCAFMLPVATPPNAVVFASGYLRVYDMVRVGIWMNILSIIIITIFAYLALPLLWDFDPSFFPTNFNN